MKDIRAARSALAALAALALGTTHAAAQQVSSADFQPRNDAGFMSIKRSFNATALTSVPGITCNNDTACALTSAIWHKGRFWVLGTEGWCCGLSNAVSASTYVHEWTSDGSYIKTVQIPLPEDQDRDSNDLAEPRGTAPEVRDMATDEWRYDPLAGVWVATGGQAVFIGTEEGIYVTRVDGTGTWHLWDQIARSNGTALELNGDFSNPIRGPGLARLRAHGTPEFPSDPDTRNAEGEGYMGVAYDPDGDGGNGSFWVSADDGGSGAVLGGIPTDFSTGGWVPIGDPRGLFDPTNASNQRTRGRYLWAPENVKPILEIDLQGNILTELVNGTVITDLNDPIYTHWDPEGTKTPMDPSDDGLLASGGEWCAGGLELDPFTGNLWVFSNMDEQTIEVDTVTGDATGFAVDPFRLTPHRQGGITGIPNGDPGSDPSLWDLLILSNVDFGDDFFTVHRGHQYPGFNGLTEPRLLTSVSPLPPKRRDVPLAYQSGDTINLLIDETGQGSSAPAKRVEASILPAVMMLDLNAATETDAATDFNPFGFPGVLPEFRVHSSLSDPDPFNANLAPTFVVPYFLGFAMPTDVETSFSVPAVVNTGQKIRMQAIYFDSRSQYSPLGAMVTNEAWLWGVGQNEVMVELVGDNSFSTNAEGFFRIHYLGGPAIEVVKLDFRATSSNFNLLDDWFDLDQRDMFGRMGVGRPWDPTANGGVGGPIDSPGCHNTFRQDSDITTGLLYAETYNYPAALGGINPVTQYVPTSTLQAPLSPPSCDYYTDELGFEYRSGLTGTQNVSRTPNDLTDLVFQFTDFDDPGDVLRFDCDTDDTFQIFHDPRNPARLVAKDAEYHAGMVVTIIQAGGNVLTGELLPDPAGGRVFIGW